MAGIDDDSFVLSSPGLLPSSGVGTPAHYIMPTIALSLPIAAEVLRMTRSTMLETIRQDYIRTARSEGATERLLYGVTL